MSSFRQNLRVRTNIRFESVALTQGAISIPVLTDRSVTLARALFKLRAVQNLHFTTGPLDSPLFLQHSRCQAYRGPVRPEHRGKEILGDGNRRGIDPVLSDQQPAGEALFDIVKSIARGGLRDLHPLTYCIPSKNLLKLWT